MPGANAMSVGDACKAKMETLKAHFPSGIDYSVAYDTTRFINASISEVKMTLIIAGLLVVLVIFLFLQSWRTTLIPLLAVPVSIIGSLAGLYALGFSINTLTLFAMVLAIGIVVDDAIVVLENVERLMREKHLKPYEAAMETMREVSGAVVAIVLVLCATFIPVAFLSGISGKLYQQFAATIAISVVISGIVALTLTPALCGILLKPHEGEATLFGVRLFHPFNWAFDRITDVYVKAVRWQLRFWPVALALFLAMIGAMGWMFWQTPTAFVPAEDQGTFTSILHLPEGASLQRTQASGERVLGQANQMKDIEHSVLIVGTDYIAGADKTNAATLFAPLKDWKDRPAPSQEVNALMAQLNGKVGKVETDGSFSSFNPPAIRGLGTTGGFEFYIQSRASDSPKKLAEITDALKAKLAAEKTVAPGSLQSYLSVNTPQLRVNVDDAKAAALGINIGDIYATLQAAMGSAYVNDFNLSGRTFHVQLQAGATARATAEDLGRLQMRSKNGGMIPLSTVMSATPVFGPDQIDRFNSFFAAKVTGDPAPGVSSGATLDAIDRIAKETLPSNYTLAWSGQSRQEQSGDSGFTGAFGFSVVMVFLILAAQYEKWSLPMAVILAVPFALFGAIAAVAIRAMPNDIYFQIGLVTLIGLAAKNGILIVEFAQQKREEGMSPTEAAVEAARLRFRPIVMTSLAFVLGVVPLVWSEGAGSAARRSLGTGVFGGMLAATFIATLFIPLFFRLLAFGKATRGKVESQTGHGADHGTETFK